MRIFLIIGVVGIGVSFALLPMANAQSTSAEIEEWLEGLSEEVDGLKLQLKDQKPGTSSYLISGYGLANYIDRDGDASTFGLGFNPLFLWKTGDRILFESEFEIEMADGSTEIELEYAEITYIINDYVTAGAGKFLSPFGIFRERLHPSWINKLPDAPLALGHDGISPITETGVQLRGGIPIGSSRFNYAVYLSNGPELRTGEEDDGHEDDGHGGGGAGTLDFENSVDGNDNKAVGGRIGFLPMAELEIGYSIQSAEVGSEDGVATDALLQGVDISYVRDSELLKGILDIRFEWVWSDVDGDYSALEPDDDHAEEEGIEESEDGHVEASTRLLSGARAADEHDDDGIEADDDHGPASIENKRNGGYVQIAYRPSKARSKIIKNMEVVGRYDMIDNPDGDVSGVDQERYTFGLNYWYSASGVIKFAYQIDDKDGVNSVDNDAVLVQAAFGF